VSTHKRTRRYELKARAERQRRTRERIVDATVALHAARGPARTTIAEIARLAGVQRVTVYNTFPTLRALFGACQGRFLAVNPPPDLQPRAGIPPLDSLQAALGRLYAWYRANEAMQRHVYRDRHLIADLDAQMAETVDANLAALGDNYARAIAGGRASPTVTALVRLALRFETWETMSKELPDAAIVRALARAIEASSRVSGSARGDGRGR
jgi:AcrR family transcriptional regulator